MLCIRKCVSQAKLSASHLSRRVVLHSRSVSLSLSQGVLNFVQYKFSHLAPKERQTMYELSKMFLLCLNYWKLETPSQFRQRAQKEDAAAYKVDYTRCVCELCCK